MKSYPSIVGWPGQSVPVYVFDKLDGSNVRAEASRKRGFYKFGRRNGLLDHTNPILRDEVEPLIRGKYEDDLMRVLRAERWEKAVFFFEFHGPNSFAGNHEAEPHDVTLIDVSVHRKGFMEPRPFLKLFGDVDHAALLHHGNFNQDLAEQVASSTLSGMTFEGVVCKGSWDRKAGRPLAFKWKSRAWREKLRDFCAGDEKLFARLL